MKLDENFTIDNVTLADVRIRKINLDRKRVSMIAQSAIMMFFLYILVGLIGLIKSFFSIGEFLVLLLMGILILVLATNPYMNSLKEEHKFLDSIEKKIKKDKKKSKLKISRRHIERD